MSEFFESEIIRQEMEEIFEIQKELYSVIMRFGTMSDVEKKEHMDKLVDLLDRQEVMWTRLSLSDDPEAKKMKEKIMLTSSAMGFKDVSMNMIFQNMRETLDNLSKKM
tara:strand:+ start:133 stop:456 length:324 start_codon:yes stop_codon:yes gene_type:complete